MQKKNFFLLSAASLMLFTSCSKLGALSADNFNVVPNPLETQAGTVPATINGHFPEKYMKKKAVVYQNFAMPMALLCRVILLLSKVRMYWVTTRPFLTKWVVTIP